MFYSAEQFDVVVVDDGGSESLNAAVAGFRDQLQVTFVRTENYEPGAARKSGAKFARWRYLAFTDDCIPDRC